MDELIKNIRSYIRISQQEFADKLGVTFATINRWENNKASPTMLAQLKLYEFCKELNIPVYDMIINRINEETDKLDISKDRLILYHGSKTGIKGDIKPKSRTNCDFGTGFYMGTEVMQPLTLICDFNDSKLYIVSISLDNLSKVEILPNLDWALLVAYNRGRMNKYKDTSFYEKYQKVKIEKDIIIGRIADDRMFYVLDNFFLGFITDEALIKCLSVLNLGTQYVAVTDKACKQVRIEKEIKLSYFEKLILSDISRENREKGIAIANKICKDNRRNGLYFDEILSQKLVK